MKTAVASPEDGPDKKKFGIPKKDKKGLAKKTEYEYKSESMSNKKNPKPKDKNSQNISRSPKDENPHMNKPRDYKSPLEKKKPQSPKNPKKESEDNIGRKGPKDPQFEKSYKVVPNKLKTKEDLNKKDAPSTKKGKQ
jgi:hypothetical protein